jgi:tetratricopeptide (TPR) repeat protein
MPLAGAPVAPQVWLDGRVAWLLSGSVRVGDGSGALHRTVGLRRGGLARAEAGLHNLHGLSDYGAGDLDAARREFARALAADARFVDALYNAASVAALADRTDEALALLRRAVAEDPRRVEVLARNDEDLAVLRRRPDVRKLLGLVRPAPGDREPLR